MTTDAAGFDEPPTESLTEVISAHPVSVAFLFGSHARGTADERSDVDVAVTFRDCRPGDPTYNETLLGLSSDLAETLGTDAVDVVDLHSAPDTLVVSVLDHGTRLLGTDREIETLRAEAADGGEKSSPAERFDDALAAIDDHLA